MNIIQTLYLDSTKDEFYDSFGWAAPEYHLMGWALSCLQLHKLYGNITLFSNTKAAHLLIDLLKLPYNKVHITHDKLSMIHPDLWALPKIYTYSIQEQPFLHIDGDVFIFKPLNPELLQGELIAQNVEVATENYYMLAQKELTCQFTFFPPCVKKDFESGIPFQACNAGILGGSNIAFFSDYSIFVFDYIKKNADRLKHVNVSMFNMFFEQHLFYALAKEKGISVSVLFKGIVNDNGYKKLGDFHEVSINRSYLHLLGHFKKDEYTCIQMASKLKELYPDFYERIVAMFYQKKLCLSPCGFKNNPNLLSGIDEHTNTHLQRLKLVAKHYTLDSGITSFQNDFEKFYSQLISFLKVNDITDYLFERDLIAQHWYYDLFADMTVVNDKVVVFCPKSKIIESSFNWAGLFNKHYRVGTEYYSELQIEEGVFYNLVVPEATDNGFSLYDINELDHTIIAHLTEPLSINEILLKMQIYFDDDVLQNHYEAYKDVIISSIKALTLKKAIQPL